MTIIIVAVPADNIREAKEKFNSFNNYLQFAVEREVDNSNPFLDTKTTHEDDGTLILDW